MFLGNSFPTLPRRIWGIVCAALMVPLLALAAADAGSAPATAPAATSAPAATTTAPATQYISRSIPAVPVAINPAKPSAEPPAVLPDPVPDNVNPFADKQNPPKPLKIPSVPASLRIDVLPENFDGLTVLTMLINGPDFVWATDPLSDWRPAPTSYDESAAFVYETQPKARLSFYLYKGKDLMPEITPGNLIQYLAAMRASAPDSFVCLTPFVKDDTNLVNPVRFSGFIGQGVAYASAIPSVLVYHVWVVDLNHQYQLVIKLASPPVLVDRLDKQVRYTLGRGDIRKGLGQDKPAPKPAPAAGSSTARAKPTDG